MNDSEPSDAERWYLAVNRKWETTERGYSAIQSTKPQTVGYGLNDSPAGFGASDHTWFEPLARGEIDDPNLTDKKFPGNPTLSYRSRDPLRVVGEVAKWQGHPIEQLQQMRNSLKRLKAEGAKIID